MESYQVAVDKTFEDFILKLVQFKMRRRWEGLVEVHPDIRLLVSLLHVLRDHEQVAIVDPNCFGLDLIIGLNLVLNLDNFLGNFLVNEKIVLPVAEVVVLDIVQILEVVEQRPDDVLVKQ